MPNEELLVAGNDRDGLLVPAPRGEVPRREAPLQLLNLRTVHGGLADTDLEPVLIRGVVAARHLNRPVEVEVEEGEVEERGRTDTEVDDVDAGRPQPLT